MVSNIYFVKLILGEIIKLDLGRFFEGVETTNHEDEIRIRLDFAPVLRNSSPRNPGCFGGRETQGRDIEKKHQVIQVNFLKLLRVSVSEAQLSL